MDWFPSLSALYRNFTGSFKLLSSLLVFIINHIVPKTNIGKNNEMDNRVTNIEEYE